MTIGQADLLGGSPSVDAAAKNIKRAVDFKWSLATNHLNVVMMLAAGLILPKSGFGKKYYLDTLDFKPGWIPLFKGAPPIKSIEHCISETKILKPCVLEISLMGLEGSVSALTGGNWVEIELDSDFANIDCVLIPAPLAISSITQIIFPDKNALTAFKDHVAIVNNCPIEGLTIKTRQSDFKGKGNTWPLPTHEAMVGEAPPLLFADAVGGVIANLNMLANSNDNAVSMMSDLRLAVRKDGSMLRETISSRFKEWWQSAGTLASGSTADMMFWGICTAIFQNKNNPDFESSRDVALYSFQEAANKTGGKALSKSEQVISDIKRLYKDSDVTFTELLEKHPTPLPRALVLFFVHDDIKSVLESNRSDLNNEDVVLFAILSGLSKGWLDSPNENKTYAGLNSPASSFIAKTVEIGSDTPVKSTDVSGAEQLPVSIREVLTVKDWRKHENEVAIALCRECKWPHMKTRISLGEGEYTFEVKRGSMQIVLDGEVKSVSLEVSRDAVLKSLADTGELPAKSERKLRSMLKIK